MKRFVFIFQIVGVCLAWASVCLSENLFQAGLSGALVCAMVAELARTNFPQ